MKLNVDLSELINLPEKMGDPVTVEVDKVVLPPISVEGEPLESPPQKPNDKLLQCNGVQVALYIQENSFDFNAALKSPLNANKIHVSDCVTIQKMRDSGKFDKYVMTNNTSGLFYITDGVGGGEYVKLNVCMNCLDNLNYKGFRQNSKSGKYEIVREFQLDEFFEKYSSYFQEFPRRRAGAREGYVGDWAAISQRMRDAARYRCQECQVDLSQYSYLLHTHHISGVKSDNRKQNLQVLCADCHSKAPNHERMHVPHHDRLTISRLRREQGQVEMGSGWDAIVRYADPAVEGLIYQCRAADVPAPDECGADLVDETGEVIANLELAWWKAKVGVAISQQDIVTARQLGWRVDTVNNTIEYVQQLRDALR